MQQSHVGAATLNRVEQGLVFQIADENVFFMLGQIAVIQTVLRHVDFFWTPKERQLLFDEFFENFVFLLVVTGDVDGLAEEHRFQQLVVGGFAESRIHHGVGFLIVVAENLQAALCGL